MRRASAITADIGGFIVQRGERTECMTIDLIYKNHNMKILVNGEDRKITAIDPCPDNCHYITYEMINISHFRIFIPDDKVRIKNGEITFKKEGECMKYIVEGEQIINAVRSALEEDFSKVAIVDLLMKNIEDNIWTVLEDDCQEFVWEDWDYIGD